MIGKLGRRLAIARGYQSSAHRIPPDSEVAKLAKEKQKKPHERVDAAKLEAEAEANIIRDPQERVQTSHKYIREQVK